MTDETLNENVETTTENTETTETTETTENVEATTEEKVETTSPQDDFVARFKALSQKEKSIQNKKSNLKAEERELEELRAFKQQQDEIAQAFKTNPLKALEHYGHSYDSATEYILNNGETNTADSQLSELAKKYETLESKLAEKEQQEKILNDKQVTLNLANEIIANIEKDDKYELIKSFNRYDDVINVIVEYNTQSDEPCTWDQAAEYVENQLETNLAKAYEIQKLRDKYGHLLNPATASDEPVASPVEEKTTTKDH